MSKYTKENFKRGQKVVITTKCKSYKGTILEILTSKMGKDYVRLVGKELEDQLEDIATSTISDVEIID